MSCQLGQGCVKVQDPYLEGASLLLGLQEDVKILDDLRAMYDAAVAQCTIC